MAGYSGTPLVKKLGLREKTTFAVFNSPVDYEKLIGKLPRDIKKMNRLGRNVDFIHYFTKSASELKKEFPRFHKALAQNGMLWISWPKKSSGVETDLTEDRIREVGLACGLVDVKVCAVDETWSGLKFVYRLKDRV